MKFSNHYFSSDRIAEIAIFLVLLVCFTYTFPRWADPNQNSRLNMVEAVVNDGTFQIDKYVQNTVDYAKIGDHYYSDKAPGVAFLGIPIYAGLRAILNLPVIDRIVENLSHNPAFVATLNPEGTGIFKDKVRVALAQVVITFLVSILPSAFLGVILFRFLGEFTHSIWHRTTLILAYGLLTLVFAYAGAFYGHHLSAVLLFSVFYLAFVRNDFSPGLLLVMGLLLGYSVVTEYPAALIVSVLFVYVFYRLYLQGHSLRIIWLMVSGLIVAAGWMLYNDFIFGGPFNLGYSYSTLWTQQHHTGFMSLTFPHWDAIWGITFGDFRGLFFMSPILLLTLPGYFLWWRSGKYRAEFLVSLVSVLAIFLFNASSIMWWGGFAVGPRYLLPMMPFMAIPIIFVFSQWGRQAWFKGLFILMALWSFLVTWGLTLAGQSFPPDTIQNPLVDYALPNWLQGNIARNFGTVLGIPGEWSILVLLLLAGAILTAMWLILRGLDTTPLNQPPGFLTVNSSASLDQVK